MIDYTERDLLGPTMYAGANGAKAIPNYRILNLLYLGAVLPRVPDLPDGLDDDLNELAFHMDRMSISMAAKLLYQQSHDLTTQFRQIFGDGMDDQMPPFFAQMASASSFKSKVVTDLTDLANSHLDQVHSDLGGAARMILRSSDTDIAEELNDSPELIDNLVHDLATSSIARAVLFCRSEIFQLVMCRPESSDEAIPMHTLAGLIGNAIFPIPLAPERDEYLPALHGLGGWVVASPKDKTLFATILRSFSLRACESAPRINGIDLIHSISTPGDPGAPFGLHVKRENIMLVA